MAEAVTVCFGAQALSRTSNLVIFCQSTLGDKSTATCAQSLLLPYLFSAKHGGVGINIKVIASGLTYSRKVLYRNPYLQEEQTVYMGIAGSFGPTSFITVLFFFHTHTKKVWIRSAGVKVITFMLTPSMQYNADQLNGVWLAVQTSP